MAIALPPQFEQKMKMLLGEQFHSFIDSYEKPRQYGLRVNELKISVEDWQHLSPLKDQVSSIPWTTTGFYYDEQARPAKHAHYQAGLYYIQEPSAMVPVELLDIKPGQRVLDLCAAPGGKSTQIASKLQNKGVLITNDLATERTKALAKNIELAGVRNAVILNESPENIAEVFPHYFDRILVDAPCSGEGMFRKNEEMITEWFNYSVDRCAKMQNDILQVVAKMVAPGGKLVYSTCTFSPEENESQIAKFIAENEEFDVVSIDASKWGWSNGKSEWVKDEIKAKLSEEKLASLSGTLRLWPHLTDGEGHFVAVLQRKGQAPASLTTSETYSINDIDFSHVNMSEASQFNAKLNNDKKGKRESSKEKLRHFSMDAKRINKSKQTKTASNDDSMLSILNDLCRDFMEIKLNIPMKAVALGSRVYLQPSAVPPLQKLKIVRAGWYLGDIKNNKIIPSQPFIMGISEREMLKFIVLEQESEQLDRFLKGETLFVDDVIISGNYVKQNGYSFILVDGYAIGFVKIVEHMLKNEIPAGWRQLT